VRCKVLYGAPLRKDTALLKNITLTNDDATQ
jgi:hypothetical protein